MTSLNNYFQQGPAEKRPYQQTINGDAIASATWTIAPSATVDLQSVSGSTAQCRVSGLQVGVSYILACHIVGTGQGEYDATAHIQCVAP
jgi:hypothetical protein